MLRQGKRTPTESSITIFGRVLSLVNVSTRGGGGGGVVDGDVLLVLLLLHCCRQARSDSFAGQSGVQTLGKRRP